MNDTIRSYLSAGLSVIPCRADKRPTIAWKVFQEVRATEEQAAAWELPIAIVAGSVSGDLMCLDFDDKGSAFKKWGESVRTAMPELPDKLLIQRTPSGGYHVVYRSPNVMENRKLAHRKGEDGKPVVLVETRGEGGYFLAAPSPGYVLKRGDFEHVPTLTSGEAHCLVTSAVFLNAFDEEDTFEIPQEVTAPMVRSGGVSPFDDYDARENPVDLLVRYGWTVVNTVGDKVVFCRSGKRGAVSATWNHIPGRFYVFSTSTEFDAGKIYKPSAVYAILEHSRDYVAAARQLMRNGYGKREEKPAQVNYDLSANTQTVRMSDYRDRIHKYYQGDRDAGCRLGLPRFDACLRFERGYLNVFTGIPTHGKSEFVDFLMMMLAEKHDWSFVVFSPENYPLEIHFDKLAEKYVRKSMWGSTEEERDACIEYLDSHFEFIDATEEDLTLENILSVCVQAQAKRHIDCLLIDPWNEIEMQRPRDISESDFTGVCLRRLRKFGRKHNICIVIVAHPTKMHRVKDSDTYPIPTLYDISGSANFYNKADNGITIYRDFQNNTTEVHVKKVKYKNHGELGMVRFKWDRASGMYSEVDEQQEDFGYDPSAG